jgi:hypothetical protein
MRRQVTRYYREVQEPQWFLVTRCTGKLRDVTPQSAAVNRLVAGSNPARGANLIKYLAKIKSQKKWPRYSIGTLGLCGRKYPNKNGGVV